MGGHLFITRGDIRRLACDAWLLPTAEGLRIEELWTRDDARLQRAVGDEIHRSAVAAEPNWGNHGVRSVRMLARDGLLPEVWLGNVGGHGGTDVAWIVEAVVEFVQRAEKPLARSLDPQRRDRPLLAIPFVGTGAGGLARRKGQVAQELVRQLSPVLTKVNADVVLVTANDEALAAAHRARRMAVDDWPTWWRDSLGMTCRSTMHSPLGRSSRPTRAAAGSSSSSAPGSARAPDYRNGTSCSSSWRGARD